MSPSGLAACCVADTISCVMVCVYVLLRLIFSSAESISRYRILTLSRFRPDMFAEEVWDESPVHTVQIHIRPVTKRLAEAQPIKTKDTRNVLGCSVTPLRWNGGRGRDTPVPRPVTLSVLPQSVR